MNGFEIGKITEEEFKERDIPEQLWFLYKAQERTQQTQDKILNQCSCRMQQCSLESKERHNEYENRFTKLERRKRFDTAVGTASGGVGGFFAIILQKIMGL